MRLAGVVVFFFLFFLIRVAFLDRGIYQEGEIIQLEGYILESPKISSGKQVFRFEKIRVSTHLVPEYSYGDRLRIRGVIEKVKFERNGRSVEYPQLKSQEIVQIDHENTVFKWIAGLRNSMTQQVKKLLPSPESDLLIGIVLGDDSGFDRRTKEIFREVGLLHIVAASGTNVTIVGGLFYFLFLGLLGRRRALLLSIGGILFYSVLSGLSPSIQRAVMMGVISYLGIYIGRQTFALYSLVLTGMFLVLINPYIVFDIGFQLSFVATAGILVITPLLERVPFWGNGILSKDVSVTLSAYVAVFPILLYHFGSFTPFSVVANILVLWTIPTVTILGGLIMVVLFIHSLVALPVLWIAYPFLHYIVLIASLFSKILPTYELDGYVSIHVLMGYYLILLSILVKSKK